MLIHFNAYQAKLLLRIDNLNWQGFNKHLDVGGIESLLGALIDALAQHGDRGHQIDVKIPQVPQCNHPLARYLVEGLDHYAAIEKYLQSWPFR